MRTIPLLSRTLVSASGLALATGMIAHAPVARAQSFQGTVSSTVGSVNVVNGTNTTTVTVSSPSAVINWTPNDQAATGGPIDFQTAGTTATFTNNPSGTGNFAVLNRIVPVGSTRPIQFNGSVVSTLQGAAAGGVPGGTVFFYSPGGILLGASAVFNVGNLGLTTLDLANDASGNFDTGGDYVFQQATVAGAQVNVLPGAQITAPLDGSYIALVAPSVVNGGTINVNGSAALVAADAASMTFTPSGLFDIQVDAGTSATGTVVANNGTITGPAASSFFHRVYMVAVAKNDAITMALGSGSTLGFDIAGAADVVGNAIVLSAGRDVIANAIGGASPGGGTGLVSVIGSDANLTSNTTIAATGGINLTSSTAAGLDFASDVVFYADGASSSLSATAGGAVTVAGNFSMRSDIDPGHPAVGSVPQDLAIIATGGGTINFARDVVLSASGAGTTATSPGTVGGTGRGGDLRVEASNGGQITINGNLGLDAYGVGGGVEVSGSAGGGGIGGSVSVLASGTSGSTVSVLGNATINSSGFGAFGFDCLTCVSDGGIGIGGSATIQASGANSIGIGGITTINALGEAGGSDSAIGGSGTGGSIDVLANDGGSLTVHQLTANAFGRGGNGGSGAGSAQGGAITLAAYGTGGGGATIAGQASLVADAFGAVASGPGGVAASTTGGTIFISARNEKFLAFGDALAASAGATGGGGSAGSAAVTGGEVTLDAASAGLVTVALGTQLVAVGSGGFNSGTLAGSPATGGLAQITFATNGDIQLGSDLFISGVASGINASGDALAGTGVGGTARIVGSGAGSLSVAGNALLFAIGNGGAGSSGVLAQGADGSGGTAALSLTGAQADFGGTLTLDTAGLGGNGATVSGRGLGGLAMVSLVDSTLNSTGDVYLGAIGSGANTLNTGTGGSGFGGSTSFALANSTANLATRLTLEANGFGGVGAGALTSAAVGEGGIANLSVDAGSLTVANAIQLLANGEGGQGVIFGDGGVGTGGSISMTANGDSRGDSLISAASFFLAAEGFGGDGFGAGGQVSLSSAANGTVGGNAQGGTVFINAAADGGTITGTSLFVQVAAEGGLGGDGFASSNLSTTGGNGGDGGSAQGGTITLDSARGTGTGSGALNFGDVSLNAFARGQSGGAGAIGTTTGQGGNGGSATGGTITINTDRGGSQFLVSGRLSSSVVGFGGDGGLCDLGCLTAGGNATGGSIFLGSNGVTTGNVVSIANEIELTAAAYAGSTSGAVGGSALGGNVLIRSDTGLTLNAGTISIDAISRGGNAFAAGAAGMARGGDVLLFSAGTGVVNVAGSTFLSTQSTGGAGFGDTTSGGNGTGGASRIVGQGGTLDLQGDAVVLAGGFGGAGNETFSSGSGGDGFGGLAALTVGGPTTLGNGGTITIGGQTIVSAEGVGGDAFTAGSGFGGQASIFARQGSLSLGNVTVSASGLGGFGTSGGSGGAGTGGFVEVLAENAIEGPSLIAFAQLNADASGGGGAGGFTDSSAMTGGNGGAAAGGAVLIAAGAGNGVLQGGVVTAVALATGGEGGAGSGAPGGNGGSAVGGAIQIGSISGIDTGSLNVGTATYTGITAVASATGGVGGSGFGASSTATGGNGGSASGGGVALLVRGSHVTVSGSSFFAADATGGAGGIGSVDGAGGNAVIGSTDPARLEGAHLLITNRFNQSPQAGLLTAGDLYFSAAATGGAGVTSGTSTNAGGAVSFTAIGSSLTANSIAFFAQAASSVPGATPEAISFLNATGTITGGFQFATDQTVSLTLDQSALVTDHAFIAGRNWVLDPVAPVATGTLTGTTSLVLSSGLDLVAYANLSTQGFLSLHAIGRIDLGTLAALGFIEAFAGSTLSLDDVSSGDYIDLTALGAITTGNLVAANAITAEAQGSVTTGNLAAGTGTPTGANADLYSVGIRSGGNVSTGTIFAASDLGISAAGTITTGQATAYDIALLGGGNIATGGLSATNRVLIADVAMAALGQTATGFDKELVFAATPVASTAGAIAIGGPVSAAAFTAATRSTFTAGAITVTPSTTGSGQLLLDAGGALTTGNLSAANAIDLRSGASIQTGSVTSQNGTATFVAPTISIGAVQSAGGISVSGQTVTTGNLGASAGSVSANGTQTLATGAITASGAITVSGGSQTTVQSASATNGPVAVTSTGSLAIGTVDAGAGAVSLIAGTPAASGGLVSGQGTISAGNIQAAGLVELAAGATISIGSVITSAGQLLLDAGGALTTGNLSAANAIDLRSAASIQTGSVTSQNGTATFVAPTISIGAVQSAGGISVSGQTVTTGNLGASAGSVSATGTQTLATGAISVSGSITVSGGSQITVQSASATNGPVAVTSTGSLAIGTVEAGAGAVSLTAGTLAANGGLTAGQGTINAGPVQAAGLVQLAAGGAITTGSLRSNTDGVKVASFGGAVTTGQINARTDVLVSGAQSVNITGTINARDVALLSGGNVSTRSVLAGVVLAQSPTSPTGVTVTGATGRVLIANASMAAPSLLLGTSSDYSALFTATPVRLAGTVNLTGQIVAGRFVSFSQGDMTGEGVIGFGSIEVESGGLVTVAQRWGATSLSIASADIRIIDNGTLTSATGQSIGSGLRTSASGEITLISLSGSPALIGDGLTGTGYRLSSAEIGLISGPRLTIGAVDVATNPIDMVIGDLTLTAGNTNNTTTLNDANGVVQFVTGNRETQLPGGAIRIVGNVTGTGFAQTNIVEFATGRFELDAATGSLSLTQSGTTLGGTVEIAANAIHIASGEILDRLAADPFYAGHIADLDRPASVQRPDGVLRALGLDLFPTGTLYIQNTGTTLDPAGFFADFEFTDLTPPANAAPASISVIVNGKWQTAAGTVSGFAARDLVVNNADTLAFYTADSSVNGCAINASACVSELPVDPAPAIANQIEIISNDSLGNTPQFTEAPPASAAEPGEAQADDAATESQVQEEAESEADAAASPIAPPPQIIDSQPLEPQSLVEQPVAGSGNPSLIGSVVNEDSAEGEAQ